MMRHDPLCPTRSGQGSLDHGLLSIYANAGAFSHGLDDCWIFYAPQVCGRVLARPEYASCGRDALGLNDEFCMMLVPCERQRVGIRADIGYLSELQDTRCVGLPGDASITNGQIEDEVALLPP